SRAPLWMETNTPHPRCLRAGVSGASGSGPPSRRARTASRTSSSRLRRSASGSRSMAALPLLDQNVAAALLLGLEPVVDLRPERPEVVDGREHGEEDDHPESDRPGRAEDGILAT